jgi:hypothetical protein
LANKEARLSLNDAVDYNLDEDELIKLGFILAWKWQEILINVNFIKLVYGNIDNIIPYTEARQICLEVALCKGFTRYFRRYMKLFKRSRFT